MKILRLIIAFSVLIFNSGKSNAQTVNWRSFGEQRFLVNVNTGWDYSASAGVAFGYKFKSKLPLLASASVSLPFGNDPTDDWKTKLGVQAEVLRLGGFSFTVKAFSVIRGYHSSLTGLIDFGSEFSVVAGFYKKHWFVAGEFGFDKAIVTQIKNSDIMHQAYPDVKNGWYLPTGGNFFYGVQTGTSFGKVDLYLQMGKTISQDLKTGSALPVYLQLGINTKFK